MTSAAAGASALTPEQISAIDATHLWHPYSTIGRSNSGGAPPNVVAVGARGAWLTLVRDGKHVQALDAMSSWWTAIHGHGHPVLDAAMTSQLATMNHVMFGGLTHEPAARLAQLLVEITPGGLETVFFSDSGSVSVEVAVKMALQYWRGRGLPGKRRLMTWRGGYHGDTFTPMSICDPQGGMHSLWTDVLAHQVFAPQVPRDYEPAYSAAFEAQLAGHAAELAAVVVEPVVQGAGGMRFHDPRYLTDLRDICRRHDVLLVFDEIATGFGRTGELFAADHAGVSPDIMCVGKALTGGYLSLAATLCTTEVAHTISSGEAGALMHGPTFMANPLACAVSVAAVEVLLGQDWRPVVARSVPGWPPDSSRRGHCRGWPTSGCAAPSASSNATAPSIWLSLHRRRWIAASGCGRSATWCTRCRRSSARPARSRRSPPRWWRWLAERFS